MRDVVGWRPSFLDRLRALVRRALVTVFGTRGEDLLHVLYHRLLRATGRFGPPEDAATIALLGAIARRSLTIIDVGANAGRYAWFLRQHAGRNSRIVAIEPHPGAAKLLRRTLSADPGCVVLEVAAAERDADGELIVPVGAFGSPISGLSWVLSHHDDDPKGGTLVRLRRLDGLIDEGAFVVTGPVFIKIDVEGGEAGVLRGATALLRRYRPILYFECQAASLARQGETPEDVWDELRGAGYKIFGNRAGHFVSMPRDEPEIVNYLGIPDLTAVDEALDAAAIRAILDAWAARTVTDRTLRPGSAADQ